MLSRLSQLFLAYDNSSNVKLIILKSNGRAFCAGGDVAAVHRHFLKGNLKFGAITSQKMLTLTYFVSILNGIAMGGGVGISIHSKFRVATDNSVFAMPETALGLFPDVGASYFLSRLPGFFGEYLGLTGARLNGAEMLACGLATHYVPSAKLSSLEEALKCRVASSTSSSCDLASTILAIIDEYSLKKPALSEKSAYYKRDKLMILWCFQYLTIYRY
ncbi:hypothetical protein ACFX19_041758 [Malus domestica]